MGRNFWLIDAKPACHLEMQWPWQMSTPSLYPHRHSCHCPRYNMGPHKTRLIPSGVLDSGDSDQPSRCFLKLISLMLTSQPEFNSSSIVLIVLTDRGSWCHHRGHKITQWNVQNNIQTCGPSSLHPGTWNERQGSAAALVADDPWPQVFCWPVKRHLFPWGAFRYIWIKKTAKVAQKP